jgi:hypothetical protein
MAGTRPARAQDEQPAAAEAETPAVEAPESAEAASAAEIAELRQKLAEQAALVEQAAELAAAAEQRASAAEGEAASLTGQLAEAVAEAQAQPTDTATSDRLADVLEKLGERLAAPAVPEQTFRPGETVDSVVASLEGAIGVPDHSGQVGDMKTYISKGKNHRIVMKGRLRGSDARGQLIVTPGFHIPFEPDGRFETDDLVVQAFLERRPAFGVEFWELGNDPHAAPDPQPVIDTIMDAMVELDDDRLADIEATEAAGLRREVVLNTVRAARRKVQGLDPSTAVAERDEAEVVA